MPGQLQAAPKLPHLSPTPPHPPQVTPPAHDPPLDLCSVPALKVWSLFSPNFLVLLAAPQERNLLWPLWFCQGCSSRCAEPQGRSGLTHDTSLRAHSSALLVGSHPGSISSLLSKVLFKVASASCPELHPVEGEQEEHLSPTQSLYPAHTGLRLCAGSYHGRPGRPTPSGQSAAGSLGYLPWSGAATVVIKGK